MRSMLCAAAVLISAGCSTADCNTVTADVGELCVPATSAPDQETVIEIRELCGIGCSQAPGCSALLRNGAVVLDVQQEVCGQSFIFQCAQLPCVQRVVRCRIPALAEGDYSILAPGAAPRLLRVRNGGAGSCRFPTLPDGGT